MFLGSLVDSTNDVCVCVSSPSQEVAEPLQDLKEGMEQLEKNKTLRYILSTLLSIGNFLNCSNVSHERHRLTSSHWDTMTSFFCLGVIVEIVSGFNGVWIFLKPVICR